MGISIDSEGGRSSEDYTAAEVHEFQEFARSANVYESIVAVLLSFEMFFTCDLSDNH